MRKWTLCLSHDDVSGATDLERRLITRDVLPYLEALCRRLGVEFMPVEPSAVVNQSDDDQKAGAIRNARRAAYWGLLAECSAESIGVWYVSLVGDALPAGRSSHFLEHRS